MFKKALCLVSGHGVNRRRVWHDGMEFRTKCSRCRIEMARTENGWQRLTSDILSDARRRERNPSTS